MTIDRAGFPFIAGAAAIGIVVGVTTTWWLGFPLFVLAAFCVFFFRDPHRAVTSGDDVVLSPADGRVLIAGEAVVEAAPEGAWRQVSIFLSPMDVHVNRVPASGRITRVTYTPGRFLPAYRHDAGARNERSEIWIDHRGQTVVARQIVGFLARRVVCRLKMGTDVQAGDRYGIMKFGSRMDVFLPVTADIRVQVGDVVRGGQTVIAVLH
ncbi:MAG TPA: phosphatidylserine decarboxylase [Vicinamibacterales bacterium]|nr:phosphatidylserine decarboxylase [Vicinamibacterales bacterium]